MGAIAAAAANLFPDYNADGSLFSPPVGNVRTLMGVVENAIPNAQDLSREIARAEGAEAANAAATAQEAQARQQGDATEGQARAQGDQQEAATRQQADSNLDARISNEAYYRQQADATLQGNIAAEATARQTADAAEGAARSQAIGVETTARQAADTTLQGNIAAEATRAEAAAATLDQKISTATQSLQTQIADANERTSLVSQQLGNQVTQEISDREAADAAEAAARVAAVSNVQTNLNAEAVARSTADTALQAGLTAEITARQQAIAGETARAQDVEAAIDDRRVQAVATLDARIANEQARAEAAEQAEALARADADAAETARAEAAEQAEALARQKADANETARAEGAEQAETKRAKDAEAALLALVDELQERLDVMSTDVADLKTVLGAKLDGLSAVITNALLSNPGRVGENVFAFGGTVAGTPAAVPPLPADGVVVTPSGSAWRAAGNVVVAPRVATYNDPSRVHAVRFGYVRAVAASIAKQNLVRCGIACLDQDYRLIGSVTVADDVQVPPLPGLVGVTATVVDPDGPMDGTQLLPGTVYWRPYIAGYGLDGTTDFVSIESRDVTNATVYTPDFDRVLTQQESLRAALAVLNPLAAGQANGLATVDSTGAVAQLPLLKQDLLLALQGVAPNALQAVDAAVAASGDPAMAIRNRSPFVRPGDPWLELARVALGLSTQQIDGVLAAIAAPAARGSYGPRAQPVTVGIPTAAVLRAARDRMQLIPGASMAAFVAAEVKGPDDSGDSYFAYTVDPTAPVGGTLYDMLIAYLTSPGGPGLDAADALAHVTAIWSAASPILL